MIDLRSLNPPQREAVTWPSGPELVLAGAGSGKTRVIAHRIAWLVEQGEPAESILAVTFTNKAANEMRERVARLSRTASRGARIATFHSLGLWFLREEHVAASLPRWFAVCDAGDQSSLVRRCLRDIQVEARRFDVHRLVAILARRKACRTSGSPGAGGVRGPVDPEYDEIADVLLPRYEQALRAQRSLDFEDLLVRPVELLDRDAELRRAYRDRFRHVLVDEFQDTNQVQLRLLQLICTPSESGSRGRSLCAVGDDDQAIYGWRGADVGNILSFERFFPGAHVVRLEQNYRSTRSILDCANGVIARSSARRPKRLWTEAGEGAKVRVAHLPDEAEEARFVAGQVRQSMAEGRRATDLAVLYRLNAQSQPIEEAFRELGIPYRVKGGPSYFDRAEVRDVLAWLKACAFPEDDLSLSRVSNVPPRGIGDVAMTRLADEATLRRVSMASLLRRAGVVPDMPRGAPDRLAALADQLDRFRAGFRPGRILEPARAMFDELELRDHLRKGAVGAEAGARRAEAVDSVLRSIEWHERANPSASLSTYLHGLALDSRAEEPDEAEGVTLMTLHAAKGLEFPEVFLIGLEEDLLPVAGIQGEPRDLEEERRLAYVGITRAREVLWMTRAAGRIRRGKLEPRTPSRFLEDLPPDAHVRHDLGADSASASTVARSTEVLKALRARLPGSTR